MLFLLPAIVMLIAVYDLFRSVFRPPTEAEIVRDREDYDRGEW